MTSEELDKIRQLFQQLSCYDFCITTVNDCLGQAPFDEKDLEWCVYDGQEDDPPLLTGFKMDCEMAADAFWAVRTLLPWVSKALAVLGHIAPHEFLHLRTDDELHNDDGESIYRADADLLLIRADKRVVTLWEELMTELGR